jgi:hypothetical protein
MCGIAGYIGPRPPPTLSRDLALLATFATNLLCLGRLTTTGDTEVLLMGLVQEGLAG